MLEVLSSVGMASSPICAIWLGMPHCCMLKPEIKREYLYGGWCVAYQRQADWCRFAFFRP